MLYSTMIKQFESRFKELGIDHIESYYLKERGDQVLPDKIPNDLLSDFLNIEITGRTLLKKLQAEEHLRQEQAMEQAKQAAINEKLSVIISQELPLSKVGPVYKHLWDAMIKTTVQEARKIADFDIDLEGQLSFNAEETKETHSELDRLLKQAKINRFSNQRTLEDVLHDSILNAGVESFFR
jgi:hypothetical protein